MPCFDSRTVWFADAPSKSARRGRPSFVEKRGFDFPQAIPCGQCIGCRRRKQVAWGTRCYLESTMHESNSFYTLTYSEDQLPDDGGLHYEDFQLFMKRLRFCAKQRIRFYVGCEYGDRNGRPHFHVIFFGWAPPDGSARSSESSVVSPYLEGIWGKGFVQGMLLQPAQCLYVAKHNVDKLTGEPAKLAYVRKHRVSGELVEVRAPFGVMSRGGRSGRGIGGEWMERFIGDVSVDDRDGVVVEGRLVPLPRYFDDIIAKVDPALAARRETSRQLKAISPAAVWDSSPERLAVRERVALAGINRSREGRKL